MISTLLFAAAIVASATGPAPVSPAPKKVVAKAALVAPRFAADTLVMTASWANPVDDGKGQIDSLTIRFRGIMNDTTYVYKLPSLPTSAVRKHVIPVAAYAGTGGNTVFVVDVIATTFRRGQTKAVTSAPISITLTDAAPPGVTSLTATAIKVP